MSASPGGVGRAATNILMALLFLTFAYANLTSLHRQLRLSVLLLLIAETLAAVLFLIRRDPDRTRHTWRGWITTVGGTWMPLLLRPADASADLLVGQLVQASGFALQILAMLSLNRSFGLLPAHRGVRSSGAYRFVRHPLYAAYVVVFFGFLMNNPSPSNVAIVIAGTVFLVLRIREEENLLLEYPEYAAFAQRVRWRLIPAIW